MMTTISVQTTAAIAAAVTSTMYLMIPLFSCDKGALDHAEETHVMRSWNRRADLEFALAWA